MEAENVGEAAVFQWQEKKKPKIHPKLGVKEAKVKGLAHRNHKGTPIAQKTIGDDCRYVSFIILVFYILLCDICRCKRLQCFQKVPVEEREHIFTEFYKMHDKNEQDSYLAGLITINHIKRRRNRDQGTNKPHCAAYSYKLRCFGMEKSVCVKAFASIHGVTLPRLKRIQLSLVEKGCAPRDKRGKHNRRPRNYSEEAVALINHHIRTFSPMQSHYSLRKNPNQLYLPSELTVKDMHKAFLQEYYLNVPYKMYWKIFKTKFNIKFGFPRSDTCAECDQYEHTLSKKGISEAEAASCKFKKELHLRKANAFHTKKRNYKEQARAGEISCITFDFMQNLPLPHIPSNPVFYARQIWYYVFGIHDLGSNEAAMYTYTEDQAKKGSNDVTSMLLNYFNNNDLCRNLVLISDSCPGQNKNYTMLHFLYVLVHVLKMFDSITYLFPVRGHSYLPNDQDFSLISRKKRKTERVEIPEGWDNIILQARAKPSPFRLVKVDRSMIFDIKSATDKFFLKNPKPAIKIKNLKMLRIESTNRWIFLKDSYSGEWRSSIVASRVPMTNEISLNHAYDLAVPIKKTKLDALEKLLPLLHNNSNRKFYEDLTTNQNTIAPDTPDNIIIENDDNSSGCED